LISTKQKICFIGEGGVGKTSLLSLLQGRDVPYERIPTVGLEVEDSSLNGNNCSIWDLGGQKRFKFMWSDFLRGAGLAVIVCDSTEKNVEKTKEIYDRFERSLGTKIIAIANKQDLPGAMSAQEIQKKLGGLKTYGMSAIRPELRQRMKEILEYETATF
jgi:small GTP-binding protein